MKRLIAVVLGLLISMVSLGDSDPVGVERLPTLSSRPPETLAGQDGYRGSSVADANGGHPVRNPRQLWLEFVAIAGHGGAAAEERFDEPSELIWESNCNTHIHRVETAASRLKLRAEESTLELCLGPTAREEDWLERFFGANPHWHLADGHLTLTSRGSRIVMGHRRPQT